MTAKTLRSAFFFNTINFLGSHAVVLVRIADGVEWERTNSL